MHVPYSLKERNANQGSSLYRTLVHSLSQFSRKAASIAGMLIMGSPMQVYAETHQPQKDPSSLLTLVDATAPRYDVPEVLFETAAIPDQSHHSTNSAYIAELSALEGQLHQHQHSGKDIASAPTTPHKKSDSVTSSSAYRDPTTSSTMPLSLSDPAIVDHGTTSTEIVKATATAKKDDAPRPTSLVDLLEEKGIEYPGRNREGYDAWLKNVASIYFSLTEDASYERRANENIFLTQQLQGKSKQEILVLAEEYQKNHSVTVNRDEAGSILGVYAKPIKQEEKQEVSPKVDMDSVQKESALPLEEKFPLPPPPEVSVPANIPEVQYNHVVGPLVSEPIDRLVAEAKSLDNLASKVPDKRQPFSIFRRPDHVGYSGRGFFGKIGKFLGETWDWTAGRVLNNVFNTTWDVVGSNKPTLGDHFGADNLKIIKENPDSSEYTPGITSQERLWNRLLAPTELFGLNTLRNTSTAAGRADLALSNHDVLKTYLSSEEQQRDFEMHSIPVSGKPWDKAYLVVPIGSSLGLAYSTFGSPIISDKPSPKELVSRISLNELPGFNRHEILGDNSKVGAFDKTPEVRVYSGEDAAHRDQTGNFAFACWTDTSAEVKIPSALKKGTVNIYELGDINRTIEQLLWAAAFDPIRYWALAELLAGNGHGAAGGAGGSATPEQKAGRGDRIIGPIIR